MKYLRFKDNNGQTRQGELKSDGSIALLKGEIMGQHEFTGEICRADDIAEYLPPVPIINLVALGANYTEHIEESKVETPDLPLVFLKAISSLNAHGKPIILPRSAPQEVDYEAELGVIIGKPAKNVAKEDVDNYIFGYTCVNDVSARDCQLRYDKQWARGKSFDTFCPVGPVVQTEFDPTDVRIRLFLNGQCLQDDSTKKMIYSVRDIISYLSHNMTLPAGTLVLTGTPCGVGFARDPQVFLQPGDKVVVEIDGIGKLENDVTAE
ncbi:MAG: fumarylacetoacetate hydrolase family protein [Sedimentisphaerales bacterium]|nr:fumarylacetoacetate hydrolase family protein [Sedimentisphaerales bacterium]